MINSKNPTIALIDSGVGGVAVIKKLINQYKAGNYIYFADNFNMPYGNKSKKWLKKRIGLIIEEINSNYKPDLIIIACNTASTCINANEYSNVHIMKFNPKEIFFATKLTKNNLPSIQIIADSNLASNIEKNIFNASKIDRIIKYHTKRYGLNTLNSFTLGCTHYELVKDKFEKYCPNSIITCNSENLLNEFKLNIVTDNELNIIVNLSKQDYLLERKILKILER